MASSSSSSSSSSTRAEIQMRSTGLQAPYATHTLEVGLPTGETRPSHLVFAIDTSQSMMSGLLVKVHTFAERLYRESDAARVTVISWSGERQCQTASSTTGFPVYLPFRGSTDFREAFRALGQVVEESETDVVYIFLTDGQHSRRDPVGDTLVERTLLAEKIQAAEARGIQVTGHALVLTRSADVAISNSLVTPGGHLACRGLQDSLDDLYEIFGGGQTLFSDVSVILGGEELWSDRVALRLQENGQMSALADVFLEPGLEKANDYVIEVDGVRQVVEVSPCVFFLSEVGERWAEIKQLYVADQIRALLEIIQQLEDWIGLARRELADITQAILASQTLSQTARESQIPGILTRLTSLEGFASLLTFGGVSFSLRCKGNVWDAPRRQVSEQLAEQKQAASDLLAQVRATIQDLAESEARGYQINNQVLQTHATRAYSTSADQKRAARRAKLRLRKLEEASEKLQRFDLAMQILRSEGRIPEDHVASEVWQCLVSFDSASEAPGGLVLELVRPDHAFDDPTSVWVRAVGGFLSFEVFFRMVEDAMEQGRSNSEVFFGADGVGTIGGILPLALYDKHWQATFAGFYEQAIGMTVAGDAFGFKSFMAPVIYGKALMAIWEGTVSEMAVHRLLAVVDTIRKIPAPQGGFGAALADFAAHRFPEDTGARLEPLAFFAAATFTDREQLVSLLGLILSEMIRRSTKFTDYATRVDELFGVSRSLLTRSDKAVLRNEDEARQFFWRQVEKRVCGASGSYPELSPQTVPIPIINAIVTARNALAVFDAIQEVDFTLFGYEFGVAEQRQQEAIFATWKNVTTNPCGTECLDWVCDTFGVDRLAVFWPWVQPNSQSTSQARALGDNLATIFSSTRQDFRDCIAKVRGMLEKRDVPIEEVARMMIETDDPFSFAGLVLRYVRFPDPLARPAVDVIQAFRNGLALPLWKLRVLFKGVMPFHPATRQASFGDSRGIWRFPLGLPIVPTRSQRKRIKYVANQDPERRLSKNGWRRLFGIRGGVPAE